jgi:hypothetical protein
LFKPGQDRGEACSNLAKTEVRLVQTWNKETAGRLKSVAMENSRFQKGLNGEASK